jgi:hypothetical protein
MVTGANEEVAMWWECSECGGQVERVRPPALCATCGTAGVIFVPAEVGLELDPDADSFRDAWLRVGLERAHAS